MKNKDISKSSRNEQHDFLMLLGISSIMLRTCSSAYGRILLITKTSLNTSTNSDIYG